MSEERQVPENVGGAREAGGDVASGGATSGGAASGGAERAVPKRPSIAERLGLVNYRNQGRTAAKPHIEVDTSICNTVCPHNCTVFVCPAKCYTLDEIGDVHFQFEDCIECGTCMYACDQGAVTWRYPDPEEGRGVNWNLG